MIMYGVIVIILWLIVIEIMLYKILKVLKDVRTIQRLDFKTKLEEDKPTVYYGEDYDDFKIGGTD